MTPDKRSLAPRPADDGAADQGVAEGDQLAITHASSTPISAESLPLGWTSHVADAGTYYFHAATDTTQWEYPVEAHPVASNQFKNKAIRTKSRPVMVIATLKARAKSRHGSSKFAMVAITIFKSMKLTGLLTGMACFHLWDLCLDCYVAYGFAVSAHMDWGIVILVFMLVPLLVLGVMHLKRGDYPRMVWSMSGLSYFMLIKRSASKGVLLRALKLEACVYSLGEGLPQFFFQAILAISQHFIGPACEEVFDKSCMRECCPSSHECHMPKAMQDAFKIEPSFLGATYSGITRKTCSKLLGDPGKTGGELCLRMYEFCLDRCSYLDKFVEVHDFREQRLYEEAAKATRDLQMSMQGSSGSWFAKGCQASASSVDIIFPGNKEMNRPSVEGMTHEVEILGRSLLSMAMSLIAVSGTLTLRNISEGRGAPPGSPKLLQAISAIGWFMHFLFDFMTTALALTLSYVSIENPGVRACVWVTPLVVIVGLFLFVRLKKGEGGWKDHIKLLAAIVYVFVSPLANLPKIPDLPAWFARTILISRSAIRIAMLVVSHFSAAAFDQNYTKGIILCAVFEAFTFASTGFPGPSTVWTSVYDRQSEARAKKGNDGLFNFLDDVSDSEDDSDKDEGENNLASGLKRGDAGNTSFAVSS